MSVALCCLSHSPLIGLSDPPSDVLGQVAEALECARSFVSEFDPELVVLFAPDHFNGFLYNVLPQFCIGTSATSIGDYLTTAGSLAVPGRHAEACIEAVLAADVDVAISAQMSVDHAFAQPLEQLTGALDARPVIPVFVNAAAPPLGPMSRSRRLGEAVGSWAAGLGIRVLLMGSGGLSHDPPTPTLKDATPETFERLISGLTPDAREKRQRNTISVAAHFAAGTAPLKPLAPTFDMQFLDLLEAGRLGEVDAMDNAWLTENIGCAVHEIRTWVAAFSGLAAANGQYRVSSRFYRPIPEWIAGYGVMTASGDPGPLARRISRTSSS